MIGSQQHLHEDCCKESGGYGQAGPLPNIKVLIGLLVIKEVAANTCFVKIRTANGSAFCCNLYFPDPNELNAR